MSNDKKRKKLIITIVIVLVVINVLVFSILFLDLSKYIWPEVEEPPTIQNNGFQLSSDGTVTIDGITYKKKDDGNFIVISCDKNINDIVDIRERINEEDEVVVNEIGEKAFENCTEVPEIIISSTITKIGNYAFSGCSKLNTITLPYSVTEIGDSIFYDCRGLTSIKVAVANQNFTHYNGVLYDTEGKKLYAYPLNKSDEAYKLSDNLESIENNAFRGFERLKNVMLPKNLTHIGDTAFENCINLESVLIPKSVTSIGNNAFLNCSANLVIYGEKDSYAEKYAKDNNITFKLASERPSTPTTNNNNNNNNDNNNNNNNENNNQTSTEQNQTGTNNVNNNETANNNSNNQQNTTNTENQTQTNNTNSTTNTNTATNSTPNEEGIIDITGNV